MMTNGDHERRMFLIHPHTYNFFFLARHLIPHFNKKNIKRFPEVPEYAEMRHNMMTSLLLKMTSPIFQRVDVRFINTLPMGWYRLWR